MDVKDRIQKEGINKWYYAGCKGTLEYATGVGKSRCGVLAAQWLVSKKPEACILILTPTQTIRDQAWRDEFKKWKAQNVFEDNVECVCIQTAYKFVGKHYDLVIADEIHNYIPASDEYEYFKFFENNTILKILGLSASIDDDLKPRLDLIAPICDSIDTNKAVELGLVSPFEIYNIPVDLDEEDLQKYKEWDLKFQSTFHLFERDLDFVFKCMKDVRLFKTHLTSKFNLQDSNQVEAVYKQYRHYPMQCYRAMMQRKQVIYEASTKLYAVGELSKIFDKRKGVIFSQTAVFADKVGKLIGEECVVEHSKIKPKRKRLDNLKKFQDGRTKVRRLSAVKSLNEGANLKGVDFIIIAAGTSKLKDFIQRVGRSIRWQDGKVATIVRLYVKDSQEEKWIKTSQEGYQVTTLSNYKELETYVRTKELADNANRT